MEISEQMKERENPEIRWPAVIVTGMLASIIILFFIFADFTVLKPAKKKLYMITSEENLKFVGVELMRYALDHNDLYPDPNRWCDLISKNEGFNKEILRCPDDNEGPCSYALNPECRSFFAPNDVVLAFESKPGWNQSGGSQLLYTGYNKLSGCNVLLNDGIVRFIEPNDFNNLKWR